LPEDKLTEEVVREMAKLTAFSGRLSELQEKNLKIFPLICFNGVTTARMEYDLSRTPDTELGKGANNSRISYYLAVSEGSVNDNLDRKCQALSDCVKGILWNDIKIAVYFNDIKVYG
jgi:hypothetical protein